MVLKQTQFGSLPPDIEENPRSRTRLEGLGLSRRTERGLAEVGFETAGDVASRSGEEFTALLSFTPEMISEIEDALGRLGLSLRAGK